MIAEALLSIVAMSYTIEVSVVSFRPEVSTVVEKGVWSNANGGTWTEDQGKQILRIGGSGTSGALRIKNTAGNQFFAVVGVHNYELWVDVLTDIKDNDTVVVLLPQYHGGGKRSGINLVQMVQKSDAAGRYIYLRKEGQSPDGKTFYCSIIIT